MEVRKVSRLSAALPITEVTADRALKHKWPVVPRRLFTTDFSTGETERPVEEIFKSSGHSMY